MLVRIIMKEKKLERFISKRDLFKIIGKLLEDSCLVAPVNVHGEMVFQEVKSINDIVFEYENCLNSPKDFILLNDEVLFRYDLEKLKVTKKRAAPKDVVIFGVRPCDMRAVGLLDKFFSRKFKDPVYFNKRNNLLIVTLVCDKIGKNCFCASTHSGPYLEDGFDIQLIDIGEGYCLEAESPRGTAFVRRFSNLMSNVNKDKKIQKGKVVKKAIDSKDKDFDLKKVYDNLSNGKVRDELWKDLSQRCQSCGGCLLICPTCSCFYVVDKKIDDKEGQRVRSLDACYYEGFTRMAGHYNPLKSRNIMMKRKFYHKLYQQIDEFGESGCTGCGRCNDICPGNINWLDVIKSMEQRANS